MKNISFFLTQAAFLDGSKDVTRRIGWRSVRAGDWLMAVEKGQGIKRGGLKRLGVIEVLDVRREPLEAMTKALEYGGSEAWREGFPQLSPAEFVAMFCEHAGCLPYMEVARIVFSRIGICSNCGVLLNFSGCIGTRHNCGLPEAAMRRTTPGETSGNVVPWIPKKNDPWLLKRKKPKKPMQKDGAGAIL